MPYDLAVAFFFITLLATATPGPTMLYITSCGLGQGVGAYLAACLGVLIADLIYFALTISGLSAILLASYDLFFFIKWLGVIYLIYLGIKLISSGISSSLGQNNMLVKNSLRRIFVNGFIIHISNPKTILFFSALLPQFMDPLSPLREQVLTLGAILVTTQMTVSIFYGALANRVRTITAKASSGRIISIFSGMLLLLAALWLASLRRDPLC